MATHQEHILDQFTRQAVPFATSAGIRDEESLRLVIEFCGAKRDDTVLDVACGPGIVVCAFAKVVKHASGIDVTPAMLDQARALQKEQSLTNVSWHLGEAAPLPFPDASFSIVTSRFAFHHILDPGATLAEMKRVCRPGGRVMLIDAAPPADKADAFNAMEKLRDPSHARALALEEQKALFAQVGLSTPRITGYRLDTEAEGLISRSFPNPGDDEKLRAIFRASLADDALGMGSRRDGDLIRVSYPVAVLVSER
jgi:ubiquinone/menaquinone biosynthesis C-methylase UbiE